jgi:phosphatidylserine/phosphatidylglycerophosphate/cardiolipin synthase-like enzyme
MKVRLHHNGDDVLIAWKPDGVIPHCRGFALLRRRNGLEEVVSTWVGFAGQQHTPGERRASTSWPIQKYQWVDYMAKPGDRLAYRVVPMVGPSKDALRPDATRASAWTEEIELTHEVERGIEAYFNRGVVAAQWVSRRLGVTEQDSKTKKLREIIQTPGDPFREYLAGPLGARLFALLAAAAKEKREVYAALYELDDAQLEGALGKLGARAHVVLGNGSVDKKGEDQNDEARRRLEGVVDLHARMSSPRALAHNKFLVICDPKKPRWVWTGSQNWTKTGLCTQANNSLLIDSPALAAEYAAQWKLLRDAGDGTPASLRESNSEARDTTVSKTPVRLWFTPTAEEVDLEDARAIVAGATQAVLFLMFNPGPKDTLLNAILTKARQPRRGAERLYVRGALNQDPSTTKTPVHLFDGATPVKSDLGVVLPAAVDATTGFWAKELKKLPGTFAMVHSKVVLVDPFSEEPILLTGSHNLGPKASGVNDENLLVIRGARGLASAYATNIMSIYNQYRWRFRRETQAKAARWKGLEDGDRWQRGYLAAGSAALREIEFWAG